MSGFKKCIIFGVLYLELHYDYQVTYHCKKLFKLCHLLDLNNPSRELYLENPTEGSYMKNQYPGSSPRTSCSESVESYYYSAENNESIDVEIDQSLIGELCLFVDL